MYGYRLDFQEKLKRRRKKNLVTKLTIPNYDKINILLILQFNGEGGQIWLLILSCPSLRNSRIYFQFLKLFSIVELIPPSTNHGQSKKNISNFKYIFEGHWNFSKCSKRLEIILRKLLNSEKFLFSGILFSPVDFPPVV